MFPPNVPITYRLPAGYVYVEYPKALYPDGFQGKCIIVNSKEEEERAKPVAPVKPVPQQQNNKPLGYNSYRVKV
jgi:hypothetical protein